MEQHQHFVENKFGYLDLELGDLETDLWHSEVHKL